MRLDFVEENVFRELSVYVRLRNLNRTVASLRQIEVLALLRLILVTGGLPLDLTSCSCLSCFTCLVCFESLATSHHSCGTFFYLNNSCTFVSYPKIF